MRPKIKIGLTKFDRVLELACIILLILTWVLALTNYFKSPDTVPIHYDLSGNADGYGSKATTLLLPLIPTVLFFGLTQLNKYPHIFNYMVEITADNALRQYTSATKMIRLIKFSAILMFSIEISFTVLTTLGIAKGLGVWFLPLTILLLVLPIVFAIFRSLKKDKPAA